MAHQGRWAALTAGLLVAFVVVAAEPAQADDCGGCPAFRKLGRGLANVVFGVVEVPAVMIQTGRVHGHTAGFFVGSLKGICRGAARIGAGVVDTVTFPFPFPEMTYGPLMLPEFPPNLTQV
jgi:putative exosortase-associated protein (TIGR04073 family)